MQTYDGRPTPGPDGPEAYEVVRHPHDLRARCLWPEVRPVQATAHRQRAGFPFTRVEATYSYALRRRSAVSAGPRRWERQTHKRLETAISSALTADVTAMLKPGSAPATALRTPQPAPHAHKESASAEAQSEHALTRRRAGSQPPRPCPSRPPPPRAPRAQRSSGRAREGRGM